MKRFFLPVVCVAIAFSSCSVYKNNQTPDDVYYSPGVSNVDGAATPSNTSNSDYYSTPNDQYVHMRVQNPDKWSYFDEYNSDYYGAYSPVGYGPYYGSSLSMGFGYTPWIGFGYWGPMSYWNSYYTWNSFYNPYYGGVIIVNPKISSSTAYTHTRTFNPSSYTNAGYYSRKNARTPSASNSFTPYSYSQTIRSNYSAGSNTSARPTYNRPSQNYSTSPNRTFSPSFGGGGGGARIGGGGGGGISRPHR